MDTATTPLISECGWLDSGGPRLFWRSWVPPSPHRVLRIVHGLGEHSGRYEWVGRRFAEAGFACYAPDYRGHGRSRGPRGHVADFHDYVHDVTRMEALARERHPALPAASLGHSQGGLVVLLQALSRPTAERVAVTSPLLALHPARRLASPLHRAAMGVGRLLPRLGASSRIEASLVSRDPAVVEAYRSDPWMVRRVSFGWYRALHGALERVWKRAGELALPVHVSWAGDDRLVDADAVARWAARAPAGRVDLREWPGLYHELLNEPERGEVADAIAAWLMA